MDSYFRDIEYHISKQLRSAKSRILIAVAWFTNINLAKEIISSAATDIEVIVDDNKINQESEALQLIISKQIEVTFIKNLAANYYLMHNKFCVIDNLVVITGSYNWTKTANRNDENITIFNDDSNAAHYSHEFRRIKNHEVFDSNVFISHSEHEYLVQLLYDAIKQVLRDRLPTLTEGLLASWSSEEIKNKIRVIEERNRNNVMDMAGSYAMYYELIIKYGADFHSKATTEEKLDAKDEYFKKNLNFVSEYTNRIFQTLKMKALTRLQMNYARLCDHYIADIPKRDSLLKIITFLIAERYMLSKESRITILNS